ncbi:MAG: TIGR01459 family HAD-type hydrolase [Rhodobacterales bacterium]|nr:TIGR01459 family HAD-type hydrolase [Rhodobacterales bacterium]
MTRIIDSLDEVSAGYDALLCDLWGCLHDGRRAFAQAVAALRRFRDRGGRVLLLTNSPRPTPAVAAQLDRLEVPRDAWDGIASSGDAAQFALFSGAVGRRVFHLGPPKDESFFADCAPDLAPLAAAAGIERVPLEAAEGVVCTGLHDDLTETPEDYRALLAAAKARDLPMLCANPDLMVDYGDRRIWCAGGLAQAYAERGGRVLYFGKPHPPIYDLARRRLAALGLDGQARCLAIGDGPGTDIAGARGEGIDALFVTGGLTAGAFGPDPARPAADLLAAWLGHQGLAPAYAIGQLR